MKDVLVASIGPITSDTARDLGLTVGVEAEEYTIPGLVQAVCDHYGVGLRRSRERPKDKAPCRRRHDERTA